MYAAQPEGRVFQMAENLLSGCIVAIGLPDDLLDLLRHQAADGKSLLRRNDFCAANRRLLELNGEISSAHARILRGARESRQSVGFAGPAETIFEPPCSLARCDQLSAAPNGIASIPTVSNMDPNRLYSSRGRNNPPSEVTRN